jgi:hypothetical protein
VLARGKVDTETETCTLLKLELEAQVRDVCGKGCKAAKNSLRRAEDIAVVHIKSRTSAPSTLDTFVETAHGGMDSRAEASSRERIALLGPFVRSERSLRLARRC